MKRVQLTTPQQFGPWLRQERTRQNISQIWLAAESGVHPVSIGRIEDGTTIPSLKTILALTAGVKAHIELSAA